METYNNNKASENCCTLFLYCVGSFILGLIADICFIPAAIIYTVVGVIFFVLWLIYCIVTFRWLFWIIRQCRSEDQAAAAEPSQASRDNEARARANIERLKNEG